MKSIILTGVMVLSLMLMSFVFGMSYQQRQHRIAHEAIQQSASQFGLVATAPGEWIKRTQTPVDCIQPSANEDYTPFEVVPGRPGYLRYRYCKH